MLRILINSDIRYNINNLILYFFFINIFINFKLIEKEINKMKIDELERIFTSKVPSAKFFRSGIIDGNNESTLDKINKINSKKNKNIDKDNFFNDYYLLGSEYSGISRYDYMFKYFKLALKLNNNNYLVYMDLGTACMGGGLYNESIECFEMAINLDVLKKYESEIFFRMHLTYEAMGDAINSNKYLLKNKESKQRNNI